MHLATVVVDDPNTTLTNIARELLAKRRKQEGLSQHTKSEFFTGKSHSARNVVPVNIVETEEDLGGLIHKGTQHFEFSEIWLHCALQEAINRHSLTPDDFVDWAQRSGVCRSSELLREGLKAWFAGDYVKAIHLLIPQIERGLREIIDEGRTSDGICRQVRATNETRSMKDVLLDKGVQGVLGADLAIHLLSLYFDPRGWNLRNELAQGMMSIKDMNQKTAQWVVHTILLFGIM